MGIGTGSFRTVSILTECADRTHVRPRLVEGTQCVRFTFADKLPISLADLCIEFRDATQLRNYVLHERWNRFPPCHMLSDQHGHTDCGRKHLSDIKMQPE